MVHCQLRLVTHPHHSSGCPSARTTFIAALGVASLTALIFAAGSQSSSYSEDDDRIYPGRWPRRLLMLLRLVWSTAVVKYYTAVWGYSLFLIVLMLVGFRTPESRSGWNYVRDFPAELIIWAYGASPPLT